MQFTATVSRGLEPALVLELADLGIEDTHIVPGAVRFEGDLDLAYRVCLGSRVASRVLLELKRFRCRDAKALYEGVREVEWRDHLGPTGTLAVDFVGRSNTLRDTRFGARKVKDAIVDQIRDQTGQRPSVLLNRPDLRINLHLAGTKASLGIDLSGHPLFRRGHGRDGGVAPLKETLAAGILWLAGWPGAAAVGRPFLDPMCGSGTFLTEAAGMATRKPPGITRQRWGFTHWRGHDEAAFQRAKDHARERIQPLNCELRGSDIDPEQVDRAGENVARAGWHHTITVEERPLADVRAFGEKPGFLVCNPPYGERLQPEELNALYRQIGDVMRQHLLGWQGWILAGSPALGRQLGLKPSRKIPLFNGPIECRLVELRIRDQQVERQRR